MRTHLVVAHKTVVDDHVMDTVKALMAQEQCRFHLLIPVVEPTSHTWTHGEIEAEARSRLDEALETFRTAGALATGEIGDADPVDAVRTFLRHDHADEVLLSTLPHGPSAWLKRDVLNRMRRAVRIPVHHLVTANAAV